VVLLSNNFLALLWRERIEGRVVPLGLALTLALSHRRGNTRNKFQFYYLFP
jgi:hypothetical protein